MKIDLNVFKKSFFLGRLVWIRGLKSEAGEKGLDQILKLCQVSVGVTLYLTPDQFMEMMNGGLTRSMAMRYEVFVLKGFERISEFRARRLLDSISAFRDLQMGLGIRLILISDTQVTEELDEFSRFKPIVVDVLPEGEDPGALNDRVHRLMDEAMRISEIPVKRLTEKAAIYIESHLSEEKDRDLLILLILGLKRCDGEVLRFRDFLPPHAPNQDPDGAFETHCN